jgi:type IV secretory pathway VirB2 component (pilin)
MLSRRMPLMALAAVTAAFAVTVPAANASVATNADSAVDPTVCELLNSTRGPFGPSHFIIGGASLGSVLDGAGASVGCAPPPPPPARPSFPALP